MCDDRKKATPDQLRVLVEELEYDPAMLGGSRCNKTLGRETYTSKWTNLTVKLNSMENGTMKNVVKWQQAWRDWKSNLKRKCKTGSGQDLSQLETRVLKLMQQMEQTDVEHQGIEIGKICEVDPLSSDDDTNNHNLDCHSVGSPITVTVHDSIENESQFCTEVNKFPTKRKKIVEDCPDHKNLAEKPDSQLQILNRFAAALEQQSMTLQKMTEATEQQTAAILKQTQAINSVVKLLNEKLGNSL